MATVRVFAYPGLTSLRIASGATNRPNSDSLYVLSHPPRGRAKLTLDTVTPVATDADMAPDKTEMVQIQVDPGVRVYMEYTPATMDLVNASSNSPIITGDTILRFAAGDRLSFLQVAE